VSQWQTATCRVGQFSGNFSKEKEENENTRHTLIGMASAALGAAVLCCAVLCCAVPYPGKATRISRKGQWRERKKRKKKKRKKRKKKKEEIF